MGSLCCKSQYDISEELDASRHIILKNGLTPVVNQVPISKNTKFPDDPSKSDPGSDSKNGTPASKKEQSPSPWRDARNKPAFSNGILRFMVTIKIYYMKGAKGSRSWVALECFRNVLVESALENTQSVGEIWFKSVRINDPGKIFLWFGKEWSL